jgi:hypothetical protein
MTGVCTDPPSDDGIFCDDGDIATDNDFCLDGECTFLQVLTKNKTPASFSPQLLRCPLLAIRPRPPGVGEDLCFTQNVTCTPLSDCHVAGTCFRGVCSNPPAPNGISCFDGNPLTEDDKCENAVCVGQLPPQGPCLQPVDCTGGQCPAQPPVDDGTVCPDTDGNVCTTAECRAGLCVQSVPEAGTCDDGLLATDNDMVCVGLGSRSSGAF